MPQLTRPTSDISTGGWTTDAGATSNLFQAIDESTSSDTDYVRSDQTSNPDEYVIGLRPFADPGVNTGHTLRYRYRKDSSSGDTVDLDVILQAGDWDVHTAAHDAIGSTITAGSFTLTSDEVDEFRANGGYSNARVKLVRRKRSAVLTTTNITYTTTPISRLGDLRRPSTGGPFPVVLITDDSGWTASNKADVATEAARIPAEEGFATFAFEVAEAPTYNSPVPQDNCAAALAWVVANAATYNLDATKIAMMGGSGAGHMTAYTASKVRLASGDKARLLCVAQASGPMSLPDMPTDSGVPCTACEDLTGVPLAGNLSVWQAASPQNQISADFAPMFSAYSLADSLPYAQGPRMHDALTAAGIPNRLITASGSTHGWSLMSTATIWQEAMTWLHRYLGG